MLFGWATGRLNNPISPIQIAEHNPLFLVPAVPVRTPVPATPMTKDTNGLWSVAGTSAQQFADQLTQLHVRHLFELVPGGIHSMDVWRPALYKFVQHISND